MKSRILGGVWLFFFGTIQTSSLHLAHLKSRCHSSLVSMPTDDITRNKHGGNSESALADVQSRPHRETLILRIFEALLSHPSGLIEEEISEICGFRRHSTSARFSLKSSFGGVFPRERRAKVAPEVGFEPTIRRGGLTAENGRVRRIR